MNEEEPIEDSGDNGFGASVWMGAAVFLFITWWIIVWVIREVASW